MTPSGWLLTILCLSVLCMQGVSGTNVADAEESTAVELPGVTLIDQENRTQQLNRLLEGRTVVIDFVFTSCKASCSILSAIMAQVEKNVRDRLGDTLVLISLTVDPARDTPPQLKDYAGRFATTPHWYWLTGSVSDVKQTLRAFNIPVFGKPEDHPPIMMAGNLRTGTWQRWVGIPDPHAVARAARIMAKEP